MNKNLLYKKAIEAGYEIRKGFQHYLYNDSVVTDYHGNRQMGYNVTDLTTGFLVWGCYDNNFDHLWALEDVENFIRGVYESQELEF